MKNNIMVRNYRRSTIIPIFIIQVLFFCGHRDTIAQEIDTITIDDLRKHMESIASDDTEGRLTGSPGYRKAARYAVNVFRRTGVNPGWTDEKNEKTYLQPVPLIRNKYGPNTSLTIRKNGEIKTFSHTAYNYIIRNPGKKYKTIPPASPVFIGYGIYEPEHGWDDYTGLDVEGKWVIQLSGIPSDDSNDTTLPESLRKKYADRKNGESYKYKALIKNKAAGVIVVPDRFMIENWESTVNRENRNAIKPVETYEGKTVRNEPDIPFILVHPNLIRLLFTEQSYPEKYGLRYDPLSHEGTYGSFILDDAEIGVTIDFVEETFNCYNIVAAIPGADPAMSNKYITVGAHLDHLGKVGNQVFNGANDDASGCVIILEAAKAVALHPPKRSVLFILYTAEELNLLGSKHFVKYPPVPVEQISLNINIEQIGTKNRMFPGVWAIGSPQFKEPFYKVSKLFPGIDTKNGLISVFHFDPIEKWVLAINSTDTYPFYNKNIPVIILSSGGFKDHHTPQDKINLIDYDHLHVAAKILYSFIMDLGNRE